MKLFIIDWSREATTPLLDYCKSTPHTIAGHELVDGAEAYRKTALCKPDAIIVNYATKPSHGRLTAGHIFKRKITSGIPIYFIGGAEDDNEKVEHMGICLSEEELHELLD
ncbi:hypothetical protein HYN59_09205 [Flavobacterium album]|uniref:Response regulatory domain-containing protein n=1 Tax=Flavobacterium album TaxID=2175091 RepID=A0A2S1QY07_9FLAO|nr:hypothetical protein [Flavobacterium album]AWH85283.1 hypothetical protein HYN59_09205 [Flavobacterium album]